MKRISTILVLFSIPIFLLSQQRGFKEIDIQIDGTTTSLYTSSYALIIGVSDYTNGWSDLPGVSRDINTVKQSLEGHGFNVTVVKKTDSRGIKDAFDSFISKYSREYNSRLLVYFSGHGYTLKQPWGGEMGYIVPSDAPNPHTNIKGFKDKAIDMIMMEVYAKRMDSKHALFMFDCCFSGSIFSLSKAAPAIINYKTSEPVRQFITAGSADEEVPDESIFCRQFVVGLDGEADVNKDGYISGSELGEYLQTSVVNYSYNSQHPQYGKIRNPKLDKGDFIFIVDNKPEIIVPTISIVEEAILETGSVKITSFFDGKLSWEYGFLRNVQANSTITINQVPVGKHVFNLEGKDGIETQISKQFATVFKNKVAEVKMGNPGSTTINENITSSPTTNKTTTTVTTTPYESFNGDSGTFTDTRDGQKYKWVRIGKKIWMAQNLNFGNMISSESDQLDNEEVEKYCYDNLKSNCDKYGGLYQWDETMNYINSIKNIGICPSGWVLPNTDDFDVIIDMGGENSSGISLKLNATRYKKSKYNGYETNKLGFSTLLSGIFYKKAFREINECEMYWTTKSEKIGKAKAKGNGAIRIKLHVNSPDVDIFSSNKKNGLSVRCLKK